MKSIYTALCVLVFSACKSQSPPAVLSPDAFAKEINSPGVQILDVRTAAEFKTGHISNALHADWKNPAEFKERTGFLDKNRPVLVYCASGPRSAAAAASLREKGYKVLELEGGMINWKSADKPIVAEEPVEPISMAEYKVMTTLGPVVLIDIGAPWCPPCKKMDPIVDELSKLAGPDFKVVKIDAGVQTALMKQVDAEKIPTFIIYKNGRETWRKEGLVSLAEFKAQIN